MSERLCIVKWLVDNYHNSGSNIKWFYTSLAYSSNQIFVLNGCPAAVKTKEDWTTSEHFLSCKVETHTNKSIVYDSSSWKADQHTQKNIYKRYLILGWSDEHNSDNTTQHTPKKVIVVKYWRYINDVSRKVLGKVLKKNGFTCRNPYWFSNQVKTIPYLFVWIPTEPKLIPDWVHSTQFHPIRNEMLCQESKACFDLDWDWIRIHERGFP
jgi:hypothetical protein